MRIIRDWQYKYIEKCLYSYPSLKGSHLEVERQMAQAIDQALEFFKGSYHEVMIRSFYFDHLNKQRFRNQGEFHKWVCTEFLHTEYQNGFVIRREIIYRIAMNCYALKVFSPE